MSTLCTNIKATCFSHCLQVNCQIGFCIVASLTSCAMCGIAIPLGLIPSYNVSTVLFFFTLYLSIFQTYICCGSVNIYLSNSYRPVSNHIKQKRQTNLMLQPSLLRFNRQCCALVILFWSRVLCQSGRVLCVLGKGTFITIFLLGCNTYGRNTLFHQSAAQKWA